MYIHRQNVELRKILIVVYSAVFNASVNMPQMGNLEDYRIEIILKVGNLKIRHLYYYGYIRNSSPKN